MLEINTSKIVLKIYLCGITHLLNTLISISIYEAGTFKTRQSVPNLARHIYGDCQSDRRSPGPLGGSPILPLAGTTTGGWGGIVEPTGSVGLTGNDHIYAVQGPVHFVWF